MNTGSLAPQKRDLGGSSPVLRSRLELEFALLRRLEASGPGEQWLAVRSEDQQQAIVRIVPRESLSAEHAAALERDLVRASQIEPHPHLARVLALDVTASRLAFATDQVEGDDLHSLVSQTGALPLDAAVDCCRQGLLGLQHIHAYGVAHGNLSASDVLLDYNGVLKICHWGCAALDGRCDFSAAVVKDLRGLAEVLYQLVAGRKPHTSDNGQETNLHEANGTRGAGESLRAHRASVPGELESIYARLSAAGAPQGFASAEEAIAALDAAWESIEYAAAREAAQLNSRDEASDEDSAACAGDEAALAEQLGSCEDPGANSTGASDAVPAPCASPAPAEPASRVPVAPPQSRRAKWWLYGSLAVTGGVLSVIAYLLWR